jgi:hypothetical protein
LWTKVLGGLENERSYKVRAVSTGGCIIAGNTSSSSGIFSTNHGQTDGFLIRLDAQGNVLWSRCYGGTAQDYLYDVAENPAGNFVASGEAGSNDGDLSGTGLGLGWVIYVSGTTGVVSNSIALLGPNSGSPDFLENFTIIKRLDDGSGYLVSGFTSPDFSNFNLDDIWVAKVNFAGTVLWSKKYGSTSARDGSAAIVDAGNGEFYIAGLLGGSGGFSNYLGGAGDGFLIKCNSNGDTLWTKNYGGSDWEYFNDAFRDNAGDLYLCGFSRSSNGMLTNQPSYGLADYWVVKVNALGDTIYTKRFGGNTFDAITSAAGTGTPDEFVVCGRTESNDGWVWGANGGRDIWVVKFGPVATSVDHKNKEARAIAFPNPFEHSFNLRIENCIDKNVNIKVINLAGKEVYQKQMAMLQNSENISIDMKGLAAGFYFLQIRTGSAVLEYKLIKQ